MGFVKEYGPLPKGSTLVLDISRTALAWAELREATRDLDDLRRKVEAGAGRGNSRAEIRRLEARRRKADRDYGEARAQLELVGARVRFEAKVKAKANAQTPETRERGPLTSL